MIWGGGGEDGSFAACWGGRAVASRFLFGRKRRAGEAGWLLRGFVEESAVSSHKKLWGGEAGW